MHIDSLLNHLKQQHRGGQEGYQLTVDKSWTQGRTLFGGLSAALACQAMENEVSPSHKLRAMNINFVGPLAAGSPFTISVEVLREGKNVAQLSARITQGGHTALVSNACFGIDRPSKLKEVCEDHHGMALPKRPKFIPAIPKVTPKFLGHVDLALDSGNMPFTGSSARHIHGWMRFSRPPMTLSNAHLVCLADAWPPTLLQQLRWPKPASTMSWNLDFTDHTNINGPSDWFAYQGRAVQAHNGYVHEDASIWDKANNRVITSRQVVTVFA